MGVKVVATHPFGGPLLSAGTGGLVELCHGHGIWADALADVQTRYNLSVFRIPPIGQSNLSHIPDISDIPLL